MCFQTEKYLHIHDWNYWWGVYRCAKDWSVPNGVEFSLTEDEEGEKTFFHFDFYNRFALEEMFRTQEFIESDNPDYPAFSENIRRLCLGEQDALGGEAVQASVWRAVFLHPCQSAHSAGNHGAV